SSKNESSEDFAAAYFSNGSWLSERKVSPHLNRDRTTPARCRKPVRMSAAAMASAVLSLPRIPKFVGSPASRIGSLLLLLAMFRSKTPSDRFQEQSTATRPWRRFSSRSSIERVLLPAG